MHSSLFKIVSILFFLTNHAFGQNTIDSLKSLIVSQKDTSLAKTYENLSWEYKLISSDSSLLYAKKALELSKSIGFKNGIAGAYHKLGVVLWFRGDIDAAIDSTIIAITLYELLGNSKKKASCMNNLASMYMLKGFYDKTMQIYIEVLKIREGLKDTAGIVSSYSNIGLLFIKTKDYNKALIYYNKSLNLMKLSRKVEKDAQVNILVNMGAVYNNIDKKDSALYYYDKAMQIALKYNLKARIATIHVNMGFIHYQKKDFNTALKSFQDAADLQRTYGFSKELPHTYQNIANTYFQLGNFDNCLKIAKEGLDLSIKNKYLETQAEIEMLLGKTYAKKGDYQKSNEYLFKHITHHDSLFNIQKTEALAEMEKKYQTEKKIQEIKMLKLDNELKSKRDDLQKMYIRLALGVIIILLFIVSFIIYRFRIRKKLFLQNEEILKTKAAAKELENQRLEIEVKLNEEKHKHIQKEMKIQAEISLLKAEKLQEELDHSHRELSTTAMFVYQKNEILGQISEMIEEITDNEKVESKKPLKDIKRLINDNIELTDDWDRFKLHFEKVHPKFFEILSNQYPGLTQNELKHCAYIRINLSGKEIARMLNVVPKSIQMARYRLKKKFNLGQDDDLHEFIIKICS